MSQLVNFLVSLRHSDLAHFSAIHSGNGRVMVLLFTGSDVTVNIPAHIVKYTPKGMLHGNHEVSLSSGFVKCNIIQRGAGTQERRDSTVLLLKPSVSYFTYSDGGTIQFGYVLYVAPACPELSIS